MVLGLSDSERREECYGAEAGVEKAAARGVRYFVNIAT